MITELYKCAINNNFDDILSFDNSGKTKFKNENNIYLTFPLKRCATANSLIPFLFTYSKT